MEYLSGKVIVGGEKPYSKETNTDVRNPLEIVPNSLGHHQFSTDLLEHEGCHKPKQIFITNRIFQLYPSTTVAVLHLILPA